MQSRNAGSVYYDLLIIQLEYVYISINRLCGRMERVMGIEPTFEAWEAPVLPLNYTRIVGNRIITGGTDYVLVATCQPGLP